MNKERRQELLDVASSLADAMDRLSEIRDEEQEAYDNMPEGLQSGDRGQLMQEAIDTMDEWSSEIETIKNTIETYALPTNKKSKKKCNFVSKFNSHEQQVT